MARRAASRRPPGCTAALLLLDVSSQRGRSLAAWRPPARGALRAARHRHRPLALAAVGLLLTIVGDLRDESGELFDLEAQGATPRDLRRHLLLRAAIVAALGLAGGLAAGAIVSALVVAVVTVTAGAGVALPPLELVYDRRLVVVALVALAVGSALAALAATRRAYERVSRWRFSEGISERRRGGRPFGSTRRRRGDVGRAAGLTLEVAGEGARRVRAEWVPARARCCGSSRAPTARRPARSECSARSAHAARPRARRYRSRTLGYADQHYTRALAPELTACQLVGLRQVVARPPPSGSAADGLLERVGLLDRRITPSELSGGGRQRVAICAHSRTPAEPLHRRRADRRARRGTRRRSTSSCASSRELWATTIVVSHDPQSAAVADRVVQIRDGRVSGESRSGGAVEAVVNRGGWIRLPEELVGDAARARVEPTPGGILVRVAERAAEPAARAPAPAVAPGAVVAETHALSKVHGRGADATGVFRELSVAFSAGRLSAVTGPSGSGKSTLLHLLAGLDLPTTGEVVVVGTALSPLDATARAQLRRSQIGLVTQGTDLVPFLGARESIELALALRGVRRQDAAEGAARSLDDVGLAELAGQRVARLSMGERQRVALARALAARPALLLADEPTARLDEANARAVGALFAELAGRTGTAIVCATHDPVLIEHAAVEVPLATVAA